MEVLLLIWNRTLITRYTFPMKRLHEKPYALSCLKDRFNTLMYSAVRVFISHALVPNLFSFILFPARNKAQYYKQAVVFT